MGEGLMIGKPTILEEGLFNNEDRKNLEKKLVWRKVDIYEKQIRELFEVLYPQDSKDEKKLTSFLKKLTNPNPNLKGVWVYFPWNGFLVHTLNEKDYFLIRTNRNRDLINPEEQEKLKTFTVGIAGLSIGSNMAFAMAHLGICNFTIADFDELVTSNLNRTRFGIHEVGVNKAVLTSQKLYEINPFVKLEVFEKGLNGNLLTDFILGDQPLKLIVDALDDFEIKVRLRMEAKKAKIPVLMVTSLGDSCLVDVERYDIDPEIEIFNGLLGKLPEEILSSKLTEQDKQKFAAKIVGIEHIPTRALESLFKIGKSLVGRPQLASTVSIGSGIATYIVKKVAIEENWPSGRKLLHFDSGFLEKKDAAKVYESDITRKEILRKLKN